MKSQLFSALMLMVALSGCGITKVYIGQNPTASAKLTQSWPIADFVREMEENQRKKQLDFFDSQRNSFPPSFFLDFSLEDLADLKAHAQGLDIVSWYSDRWLDMDIDYICIERNGTKVWSRKVVERRHETEANKRPEPMSVLRTAMAHH